MNKITYFRLVLLLFLGTGVLWGQEKAAKEPKLFTRDNPLKVRLSLSVKEVKKNSNDSTYIATSFAYQSESGEWKELDAKIKRRGNFRLQRCYYPPLKIKISKKSAKQTPFRSDRKLKVVLPCRRERDKNDYIVKEYWAYQLFEEVSPYYFRTRLLDVELTETRVRKEIKHQLKGMLIEDIDEVADRYDARVLKRDVPHAYHDFIATLRLDYFQYMIGNWDFSNQKRHNVKLIYKEGNTIPVPYDFDLCGLVNPAYAFVPDWLKSSTGIEEVTERVYRGFPRSEESCKQMRADFIDREGQVSALAERLQGYFESPGNYREAKAYIEEFYDILANPRSFKNHILKRAVVD